MVDRDSPKGYLPFLQRQLLSAQSVSPSFLDHDYDLGVSAYYHDSAAALLRDGKLVAAAQEERFTRKKHDPRFPVHALRYCLREAGVELRQVDYLVFYEKPLVKFERLLETYLAYAPKGFRSFLAAMPIWLKEKLYLKTVLRREFAALGGVPERELPPILFSEHHLSHAASAFLVSPFSSAAVLCLDGVGEWATTTAWRGEGRNLTPLWEIDFPHSIGLLYSAFTYYTGFKVNSGEYKVMGLAPYGEPKYVDLIYEHLLDLKPDGTFRLNMEYFNYATGLTMTNERFDRLFGRPPRASESHLTQMDMDLARSIQEVTEEVVLRLARTIHNDTGERRLCLAGGVALNCVANGRVLREGPFEDIWISRYGDAGGAVGATLVAWHQYLEKDRHLNGSLDGMRGSYLGPAFADDEIAFLYTTGATLKTRRRAPFPQWRKSSPRERGRWFQGRMGFGAGLGARSINDPRSPRCSP
jgi:carbamoyltransferase